MSYFISQGTLPACDLKEYADTSCILTELSMNPRTKWKEKEGHQIQTGSGENLVPAAYYQILQVQGHRQALDFEAKMEIIPDANGFATGLANVTPGDAIALANFATPGSGTNPTIHGFQHDVTKLLMAKDPKRSLSAEKIPMVDLSATYYPQILAPEE